MSEKKVKSWDVITYKDIEENIQEDNVPGSNKVKEETSNVEEKRDQIKECKKVSKKGLFDLSAKPYWVRNLFPVLMEAVFLIFCFKLPENYIIYASFIFYLVLFLFYVITRNITFRKFLMNVSSGASFWKSVAISTLFFIAAYCLTGIIEYNFPKLDPGFYPLKATNGFSFLIFCITALFLAPVVEETFYRGNLILTDSKSFIIVTSIVSILLYSIEHSFTVWGIISAAIWAIPLTFAYLKTKKFYVTMMANLIGSLLGNLPYIIYFLIKKF